MITIFHIILLLMTTYCGLSIVYYFIFAGASVLPSKEMKHTTKKFARIAVFIPGYKEDGIILPVVKDALWQSYPATQYDVIVIADSFEQNTLDQLGQLPVKVIEVSFEKSTKAKSLNHAMRILGNAYDIAVVLDADNMMEDNFLSLVNQAYQAGHQSMQGHRTAKNMDTPFARMDALSEEINNSIFRQGHTNLGLSSALIGSGMAFDYKLYKRLMAGIDVVSGFDKELEIALLKNNIHTCYLRDALVYDEKVQSAAIFEKQRTRWLAAQVNFALKYSMFGLKQILLSGRLDLFNKVLQFTLLPRAFAIALTCSLSLIAWAMDFKALLNTNLVLTVIIVLAMVMSIPRRFYNRQLITAIIKIPVGVFNMGKSLIKIGKARHQFLHTPHTAFTNKLS